LNLILATAGQNGNGSSGITLVNGRLPINSQYAGSVYPLENLPVDLQAKYPNSVAFTELGFPDFSPYAQIEVKVPNLTGSYPNDSALANEQAGLLATPDGFVWHHVEDGETLQLIPQDIHDAVRHTGGAAIIKGN
jgi:filamentous hemagglutinin